MTPPADDPPADDDPSVDDDPAAVTVIAADEQEDDDRVEIDTARWATLAERVLGDEGRAGELTLTFVGRAEMQALNREHMGVDRPTDVLSFPLDDEPAPPAGVPVLLGDVVVCPAVAAAAAPDHAGTLDDELALLVVHGVLHVLGHDHAAADDTALMQARELWHLEQHHWRGPAPAGFSLTHQATGD